MASRSPFGEAYPSSGPSDHLLPQGEKGNGEPTAHPITGFSALSPSPLAGEGARRADEGLARPNPNRLLKAPERSKPAARSLRRRSTVQERVLWGALRGRRFADFKFRRQVPIGAYVVDFVCFESRLIIELDGRQHAESAADAARDKWLADDGYRVLRIWNNQLTHDRDAVLDAIWHALQERPH
jgi:very-short-patch-repair endonuclease